MRHEKTGFLTRLLNKLGLGGTRESEILGASTGVGWWAHHYRQRKRIGPAASARQCTCPDPKVGALCPTIGGFVVGDHAYRIHTHRRDWFRCEHGCGCVMGWRNALEPGKLVRLRVCTCGAAALADAVQAQAEGGAAPGGAHSRECCTRFGAHDWCPGNPVRSP